MRDQQNTRRIRFLSVAARGKYKKGQEIDLPADEAEKFLCYGCACEISDPVGAAPAKDSIQKPLDSVKNSSSGAIGNHPVLKQKKSFENKMVKPSENKGG